MTEKEKWFALGEEMTKGLGLEDSKVVAYWKAFEEERYLSCSFHYGCFKRGITKYRVIG